MSWLHIVLIVYGLVNIAGGIMGYAMAKSTMSLAVGGTVGILVIIAALVARKNPAAGFRTAGVLTFGLIAFWTYRFITLSQAGDKTSMAMMNLGLAVLVFLTLGSAHLAAQKRKSA